jgi:hypothetical protein
MQSIHLPVWDPRVPALEGARTRGIFTEFYDPDGCRLGLPTYPFHWAPDGLLTRRQLRAKNLRPGGQEPIAQIMWRYKGRRKNKRCVAYLYRIELALPKRTATPAQLVAIAKALAARRTCPTCGTCKDYYIARSLGECNDCAAGGYQ